MILRLIYIYIFFLNGVMLFRLYVPHYPLGINMCPLEILSENLKNITCGTSHKEGYTN